MSQILKKLEQNGKKGIEIRVGDKVLDQVRAEVKKLRLQGYQIHEKLVNSDKHSIQQGKWVRFVMEANAI